MPVVGGAAQNEVFNPDLERAIAESPDDASAFAVYADWLHENGSPRGELASVQLAREHDPKSVASKGVLAAQEEALLLRHADLFRGEKRGNGYRLDERCSFTTYKGGFWRAVSFSGPVDVLDELLAHPSARLLYALAIGYLDEGNDDAYERAIDAIAKAKTKLEVLRVLRIGDMPEGQSALAGFGNRSCGDLSRLAATCPRLEKIRLLCPNFEIAGALPSLRKLDARLGTAPSSIASIASAELPLLTQLDLGFESGPDEDPMYAEMLWGDDSLDPLLKGDGTPALKIVRLWPWPETPLVGKFVERIESSKLGKRLESVQICTDLESEDDDGSYEI